MTIYEWIEGTILAFFIVVNGFLAILFCYAIPFLKSRFQEMRFADLNKLLFSNHVPPITTIITTFNERDFILASVDCALCVNYPYTEVVVVINGSEDDTFTLLKDTYQLQKIPPAVPQTLEVGEIKGYYRSATHQNLRVIDKVRGMKGNAVCAGINACLTPYYTAIDGDTYIEKNTFRAFARTFLFNPHVVAIAGSLYIANNCKIEKGEVKKVAIGKKYLPEVQIIEYLRSFLIGRLGWNKMGGTYLVSGGLGIYNKAAVISTGGLKDIYAEDLDITLQLHAKMREDKKPYNILQLPDARGWTQVPETVRALGKQRVRWQLVLYDGCFQYIKMFFNPTYGSFGFVQLPYLLFIEGISPFIEALGYGYIIFALFKGLLSIKFLLLFFLLAWGYTMLLSLFSIVMEEYAIKKYIKPGEIFKLILISWAEIFGYRQLTVFWRIWGFFRYLFVKKPSW